MNEREANPSVLPPQSQLTKESQTLYEEVKRKQDLVKQLEEEIGTASQQLEEVSRPDDNDTVLS
jgi:hypothetical protein